MHEISRLPWSVDRLARGASLTLIIIACVGKFFWVLNSEGGDASSLRWLISAEAFFLFGLA